MRQNPVAVISDIHGNFEALSSVMIEIDRLRISRTICAGDVSGYYSQVDECCDLLREREIPTVMGNHDWYLGGGGFCGRSRTADDVIKFQSTHVSERNREWLGELPLQYIHDDLRMVHGGWSDPLDEYLKDPDDSYFERLTGRFFVSGHTHIPLVKNFAYKRYCNPGSVGQPRDGDARASFAVLTGDSFEIHRVEYDIEKVAKSMESLGFDDYLVGGLFIGSARLQARSVGNLE